MIVYHGSTLCVENPLVGVCRDNLDFGKGFYLTDICEQAISWAKRVAIIYNKPNAYLNKYELDYETICRNYRILSFETYNETWLDFVMASRRGERRWSDYDIIEGGIANDRVFNTIELYFNGLTDKGEALKRLSYEQPNNQICLLNQSLIDKYLHFIDATNINKEERNDVTSQ